MGLGPFDLTGGPFLMLYAALFVATLIAGAVIPRWLRPDGRERPVDDPDAIAWLAGGPGRYVDAVMTRLLTRGDVIVEKRKVRIRAAPGTRQEPERALLALPTPAPWNRVMMTVTRHAGRIEERLVDAGLLMDRATAWQMRFWQTLPYGLLLGFGLVKWDVGVARDKPVGYLTAFLVATAIIGLIRFAVVDRRTRGALAVVQKLKERSDRLRRAPTEAEMPLAVALFGTSVLAGSAFGDYHTLRAATGGGDSGSSGCGSDGGGGCGGGGCGGCGG